jgi:hypothetical protein
VVSVVAQAISSNWPAVDVGFLLYLLWGSFLKRGGADEEIEEDTRSVVG